MVQIAFAAAAPALGLAGAGIGATATVAGLGLSLLAAYIDSTVTYPMLFGKKNPKPDALEGFQISTTDPGAPRWMVFGSRAWVPCHYLWSQNIRDEVSGGAGGKGGASRPFVHTVRADVGLAAADGPIRELDTVYADERPFWSTQFNRVVVEDHRWTISPGVGAEAGLLVIQATDADATDFTGIFTGGDGVEFVRLENVLPFALSGFYRTVTVHPHAGGSKTRIVLRPLQGQTPAAGVAGSLFEPAKIRRIDSGAAAHTWLFTVGPYATVRPINGILVGGATPLIPGRPQITVNDVLKIWQVGGVYQFVGWTPAAANGRYRLTNYNVFAGIPWNSNGYALQWTPLDGQPSMTGAGTAAQPGIIYRDQSGAGEFLFFDANQSSRVYIGTDTQEPDPTLVASQPDAPAHRGLAHISLANWNLGPHGNIFPRVTALVRSRSGETVASAIQRICLRTMLAEHVDVSHLRTKLLLGHSVPSGMSSAQALQPVALFYGITMQDRGGVMTFLDRRDLPVVTVRTSHLNARPYGEATTIRGFVANRADRADLPERVVLEYIDPAEGANEAEGDGARAPGAPDRGGRDTLKINLRPLVAWPHEVKRRARELRRELQLESYRGQVTLPPTYVDVLAGHVLTFVANNYEDEQLPGGPTIAFDTRLRDIVPGSVQLEVRWASGQVAALVDDGAGHLQGFPAGITAAVNTVNYATGRIELLCSEALDATYEPRLDYRYEKQWLMRVNRAQVSGYDQSVTCDLVSTTLDDPLPPLPRERRIGLGGALTAAVPQYRSHVIDLPLPFSDPRSIEIGVATAPESGGAWRGAQVYQSPNGIDRWTPIGLVQGRSVIGNLLANNLPDRSAGSTASIDWSTELEIVLPDGAELTDATTDEIGWGQNWLLVGDELIGFHEAEADVGGVWRLRGLIRGMRHTDLAMDTHQDGERVVLLSLLGVFHGLVYDAPGGYAAANRTYHLRVVPGGASVDQVPTISTLITGRSARPARPILEPELVRQLDTGDVEVTWGRRGQNQAVLFGPSPLLAGEVERYEVAAYNATAAAALVGSIGLDAAIQATTTRRWIVGDESMGTTLVERRVVYDQAEWSTHGYTPDVTEIGFAVWQVGLAGRSDRSDVAILTPTI